MKNAGWIAFAVFVLFSLAPLFGQSNVSVKTAGEEEIEATVPTAQKAGETHKVVRVAKVQRFEDAQKAKEVQSEKKVETVDSRKVKRAENAQPSRREKHKLASMRNAGVQVAEKPGTRTHVQLKARTSQSEKKIIKSSKKSRKATKKPVRIGSSQD